MKKLGLALGILGAAFMTLQACGNSSSDDAGSGGSAGSAGTGGGSSGTGGGGSVCPIDYFAADGTPCNEEGKSCSSGCTNACAFCNSVTCTNGKWQWQESFPDPNCNDAGSDASDGGGSDASSDASDGGGDATTDGGGACGGKMGLTCASGEYCDYPSACGAGDELGACKPKPQGCTADCPGVCGCDGKFYCNSCTAAAEGIDVSADTSCIKPGGKLGDKCTGNDSCSTGLLCCYPCGQAGCANQCTKPMKNGQCPLYP